MCIAIAKKAGAIITDDILERCFKKNQDGCGFSYIDQGGRLRVNKSLVFDRFHADYRAAEALNPRSPFLIHFRIKTHGTVDLDNCHPFMIDENHVFIHNGVISKVPNHASMSDTRVFNQQILQQLPRGWFSNPAIKVMLEDYIGYSKLVILKRNGEINIINEKSGFWEGDVWYSNSGYKEYTPIVKTQTTYTDGATYHGKQRWNTRNQSYDTYDSFSGKWIEDTEVDYSDWWDRKIMLANQNRKANASKSTRTYLPPPVDDAPSITDCIGMEDCPGMDDEVDTLAKTVLPRCEVEQLCKELQIDEKLEQFHMTVTLASGETKLQEFKRCTLCWRPDYAEYINKYAMEGEVLTICDECFHDYRISGVQIKAITV